MVTRHASAGWATRRQFAVLVMLPGLALLAPGTSSAHTRAIENPIGIHSMLFLDHPFSAKQAMFKEAAATGASEIRLDIELSGVFPNPNAPPDWNGIDQYMSLARRYHLRVLADLLATPSYLTSCPSGTPADQTYLCPPLDPVLWGEDAGAIAAHTRGVINDFEIINEPDGSWAFRGTPQQYAALLTAAYHAIHNANPNARVALGGLMDIGPGGRNWMNEMLTSLGHSAIHSFDIANIHVRTTAAQTASAVTGWRRYFASKHFIGPLWVTETGYPADPTQQTDPAYQGGPEAQARYLNAVIPTMIRAGAAKIFITEPDSLTGPYASEGILNTADPLTADPHYTRRPSFYTIRRLARREWRKATITRRAYPADHTSSTRPATTLRPAQPHPPNGIIDHVAGRGAKQPRRAYAVSGTWRTPNAIGPMPARPAAPPKSPISGTSAASSKSTCSRELASARRSAPADTSKPTATRRRAAGRSTKQHGATVQSVH